MALAARGELVAYLDCDDEFDPDHLARVHALRDRGEVLVFRYDLVEERDGSRNLGQLTTFNPAANPQALYTDNLCVPLGVIHQRSLLARVGGFDEMLGWFRGLTENADLWRRFAQAGAQFVFVPAKSGLYHVRSDSLSRPQSPPPIARRPQQAEMVEVRVGADRYPLQVHAGDAWLARQVFEQKEYAGVPVDRLRTPPVVLDVGAFALYAKLAYHRDAVLH